MSIDSTTSTRSPYDLWLWAGLALFCGAMAIVFLIWLLMPDPDLGQVTGGLRRAFKVLGVGVFGGLTALFASIWHLRRFRTTRGPGDRLWALASIFGLTAVAIMAAPLAAHAFGFINLRSESLGLWRNLSGALLVGAFYAIFPSLGAFICALVAKRKQPGTRASD